MHDDWTSVFGPLGIVAAIGWIVWILSTNRRRLAIAHTQAEMQAKLLDKLSASQDLAEFLKTEAGQRLLNSAATETADPYRRILGSIQAGLVLTLLGFAMIFVSGGLMESQQPVKLFGTMATAVGLGFLISSGISFALSKSWGLFERKDSTQR